MSHPSRIIPLSRNCRRIAATAGLALFTLWAPAVARQGESPAAPPQTQALPAPMVLGLRADLVRSKLKVRPTLVLVDDVDDYARLISRWTLGERFPVLIDDGSDQSREDIARFVRSFEPTTVLRWKFKSDEAAPVGLPTAKKEREEALNFVWRAAWGARSAEELDAIWTQTQFTPPGVIVASVNDPAWTAAIALAAGHGQPILWTNFKPESPSGFLSDDNLRLLDAHVVHGIEGLKPVGGWREIGDQIDAITLCLSLGARIKIATDEFALTDRIGRHEDFTRYAWCGMIFGSEARAAYMAMCALYLQPGSAWMVDGYKSDFAPPFHLDKAADLLDKSGWRVATNLPPRGSIDDWRDRTRYGISADFVHVNSSGLVRYFDLNPGRGYASDIPPLTKPALVHFIHSFSAQNVGDADSIAGRWLENGAYAYYGSMHEPYLAAFLPGHVVSARLLSRAPWAAAVRQDQGKVWKLNVFGDPLITVGERAPRYDEGLELENAVSLDADMREALRNRKLAKGAELLVKLGRDRDAVRVAQATLQSNQAIDFAFARTVLEAAMRERESELFLKLYFLLSFDEQRQPLRADLLWRVARPMMGSASEELVSLMKDTIREISIVEDAETLAPAISRLYGRDAAKAFFAQLAARTMHADNAQALINHGNKF